MKFYIVGTAEPLLTVSFFSTKERSFTEKDLLDNLSKMEEIPFFESLEYAIHYARSLRVQIPSKILDPQKRKFAPVIEIECDDDVFLANINPHTSQIFSVVYTEYMDTASNLDGFRKREETVSGKIIPTSSLDLTLIQVESVLFPDSGRDQQHFAHNQSCTLM